MISIAAAIVIAYLLGSISGSLLLGRLRGVDIRKAGSGNAGGTNALRTQGIWFALGVVVIDVGKGALAALLPGLGPSAPAMPMLALQCICGVAAVIGHVYPVFFGFRGGKGAATFVGAVAVILPAAVLPLLVVALAVILITGYVGLGTMAAAVSFVPIVAWLGESGTRGTLLVFAAVCAVLILFTHRSNIGRLRAGTENRFEKARITRWFRRD